MEPTAISEQIERILHSQNFASKGQLRKLLEVLHKNMDSQPALKPDQVIKELWPEETRTKRSADVATEINRLRHALESYYDGEGRTDPITISLPNRAAPGPDGMPEKRWIAATVRDGNGDHLAGVIPRSSPVPAVNPRKGLKTMAAIAGLGIVGCAAFISIRLLTADRRPQYGRLDGSTLMIMNAEGKELWRKTFPGGFGPDWYFEKGMASIEMTHIWFADLEGKGHTSVLFSYSPASQQSRSSTLICYSDRGKEKWRWTPGRELPELAGSPASFKTMAVAMLRETDKTPRRIVVASVHDPWWAWPSQIAILNSIGKTVSEYWNSGSLGYLTLADLDGDGREEIIATGTSRYDRQATLVMLDPDRVFGASTEVRPEFQIHGMGAAQERLRLLFPRSDLNRASFQFNYAIEPRIEHGNLRLTVLECPALYGCRIFYEFDKNFNLLSADAGDDEFRNAHNRFYQTGKDAHALSAKERAAFQRVRCLVGCKSEFVPVVENYDPAESFEKGWTAQSNPNGVWSYGYSSGFTNPVTLYDKTVQIGVNGPNAQYWLSSSADVGTSPAAEYNDGPAFNDGNVDFLAHEFLLVAGIGGQYSDLVFTAPADGEYSIAGKFRGSQYGIGTLVGIVANRRVVFSEIVPPLVET